MVRNFVLSAAASLSLAPNLAVAQSSLGITGAQFSYGATDDGDVVAQAMVDVAITQFHGIQFNVGHAGQANGAIAYIDSFVYMTPRNGQKYGLNLQFADVDNEAISYAQLGAIGMLDVTDTLTAEVRGAMGMVMDNDLDWLTAGAGLYWQATDFTQLYGSYNIAEYDELTFSAMTHDVTLGARYTHNNTPFGAYAEVSQDWMSGADSEVSETTIGLGITMTLGAAGNYQPAFSTFDPTRQILRRDAYNPLVMK